MLSISQPIINELQRYNVDPLLNLIDEYQRTKLLSFLYVEAESITSKHNPFEHNMKAILNKFFDDAIVYIQKQISTGPLSERIKARKAKTSIKHIIHSLVPNYFNLHALARLAKHFSLLVSDQVAFLAMKAIENLPFEATQEDASDYFDRWLCSTYLDECSDYKEDYKPFAQYKRNFKNCFAAWVFRCFEDNLTSWLVAEFDKAFEAFKRDNPNLLYAFLCMIRSR